MLATASCLPTVRLLQPFSSLCLKEVYKKLPQGWAEGDGDPLNGDGRTARGQVPPLPFDFYSVPSHAAELLVSPNGRFVFVTNRGHDSITVFTVGDGNLVGARTHCEPPRTGPR